MKDLACFNKALMGKWAWRAVIGGEELWCEIIRSSMDHRGSNFYGLDCLSDRNSRTGWWGDVVECIKDSKGDWFQAQIRRVVGNGENTSFWTDTWAGNSNLKTLFPRIYNLCLEKSCSVARAGKWVGNEWNWNVEWRRSFRECELEMVKKLVQTIEKKKILRDSPDVWKWEMESSGVYSVKSSYYCLINRKFEIKDRASLVCKMLWNNCAVQKAKATAWRAIFRKLPTKTELRRRGVIPVNASVECPICRDGEESVQHLFAECRCVGGLWGCVLDWLGIEAPLYNSIQENFVQFCYLVPGKEHRNFLASLWICVVWSIWKARNNIIFKSGVWKNETVIGDVKSFLWA